jgi:hypothetical protein
MTTRLEFLDALFAEIDDDEQVCVSRQMPKDDGGAWFSNHLETDRQWRKWRPEDQAQAWYFCVSTVTGDLNAKGSMVGRGRQQLVKAHCLVLDDIGTKADAPPVQPSWKLESSEGNFQWGYFIEPYDDMGRYEALVEHCHQRGWGDAGAGGSYRVMRVPGSANLKPGRNEFRSRITDWSPDLVWDLDVLADELGCDWSQVEVKSVTNDRAGGAEARENIDPMLDWLSEAGHIISDTGEWVDVVCPWAESHTSGSNLAGYSPLGRGSDSWVQTRAFRCLHEHCVSRKLKDFVAWAEEHGGPFVNGYDPMPWLQSRYAYVGMGQQVVDLEQRVLGGEWIWDFKDWARRNPGKIAVPGETNKIKVADAFVASSDTQHVDYTAHRPVARESDVGVLSINGQRVVNTYVPPNWAETDALPEMFIEHLNFLIPDPSERQVVLDWLAYKIQHPDRRSYCICMVADNAYGTGRSWLKRMLGRVLQGKVNTATLSQLIGMGTSAEQTYNDWMICQFLIVEEAKEDVDRDAFYKAYETFKQNIDPAVLEDVRINPKFGRTRMEHIYYCALIFSNHSGALALPGNDRRVFVASNPKEMNTPEYYDRLEESTNNVEAAKIYWWLMHRDISRFDPIYPPMTPGKMAMIEQNVSPADEIYEKIIETALVDLVIKKTLKKLVEDAALRLDYDNIAMKPGAITGRLWAKLGALRPEKNGARYTINDDQQEIRALRDVEKWKAVDEMRDRDAIVGGLKPPENVLQLNVDASGS